MKKRGLVFTKKRVSFLKEVLAVYYYNMMN